VELRLFQDGTLAQRRLCESSEEAVRLVQEWADRGLSQIEIDDLSAHHGPDQILEPELVAATAYLDEDDDRT
jgi:hypothetical protein